MHVIIVVCLHPLPCCIYTVLVSLIYATVLTLVMYTTVTVVGYNQSVYTLFEEDGYLEMCIVVTRNGSLTPFFININTTNGTAGKLCL